MKVSKEVWEVFEEIEGGYYDYWVVTGDDNNIHICFNMNDFFGWGCADDEEITYEDLPLFRRCVKDIERISGNRIWVADLFACRKRKQLPQSPVLENIPEEIRHLFLEAVNYDLS